MTDNSTDTPATDVAYENTADLQWALQALDLLQNHRLQVQAFDTEGVISAQVWGTCPRCSHELNVQQTLSSVFPSWRESRGLWATLAKRDAPAAPRIPDTVEVGCGCGHTHPGAPEQVRGCGVSFRLPTTPPATPT